MVLRDLDRGYLGPVDPGNRLSEPEHVWPDVREPGGEADEELVDHRRETGEQGILLDGHANHAGFNNGIPGEAVLVEVRLVDGP